jgi:hypothetical protein
MRVALIVVAIAMVSSPSLASPSCMTLSEARARHGNAHLYWHGPGRCWDASPGRRQLAKRIKVREREPAEADVDPNKAVPKAVSRIEPKAESRPVEAKKPAAGLAANPAEKPAANPASWAHETRWREAMSKMLPEDAPVARAHASAESAPATLPASPSPRADWHERWVDVAAAVPPIVDKSEPADLVASARRADSKVTPLRVMLALLTLVLSLGIIEIVFRGTIPGWRS